MTDAFVRRGGGLPVPCVKFEFRYGWCTLTISVPGVEISIKATGMLDFFADLVLCFENLLAGVRSQSCIWGGEGRGWFIDMTSNWNGEFALVVHEMADGDYLRPGTKWLPIRGRVISSLLADLDGLGIALVSALEEVKLHYSDEQGHMPDWGWEFPRLPYVRLRERLEPLSEHLE